MKFITVSYFADPQGSDYYRKSAERLAATLDRLGLERNIQEIAHRGSYRENCIFKPVFILRELLGSRYPLLWLDADSNLLGHPKELVELRDDIDIAVSTPDGNRAAHSCRKRWPTVACFGEQIIEHNFDFVVVRGSTGSVQGRLLPAGISTEFARRLAMSRSQVKNISNASSTSTTRSRIAFWSFR